MEAKSSRKRHESLLKGNTKDLSKAFNKELGKLPTTSDGARKIPPKDGGAEPDKEPIPDPTNVQDVEARMQPEPSRPTTSKPPGARHRPRGPLPLSEAIQTLKVLQEEKRHEKSSARKSRFGLVEMHSLSSVQEQIDELAKKKGQQQEGAYGREKVNRKSDQLNHNHDKDSNEPMSTIQTITKVVQEILSLEALCGDPPAPDSFTDKSLHSAASALTDATQQKAAFAGASL
eukprot:CAMPEP_0206617724 /NCGR_PEP_ID=MMETSP0325_2-20121206/59793_1 /ASSEMBLY_ACC=CAM_ASM_000347 /TAXON_ID=2866 /ORGANISM="Crypthecodinium cohnii, Strain Seligo" /LENGTH=230 /DNA_ID=CAMNT_0054139737 /DNA_START=93 /DNA_END=782 /DNA_ORIENTATION=+